MKRTTYEVRPRNGGWGCKVNGKWIIVSNAAQLLSKETYVAAVKRLARDNYRMHCVLGEVVVYTRRGRIGKGSGSRTTYGRDPRKTKG